MSEQHSVDTLRIRYVKESRQNVILRTLVREARAFLLVVGPHEPIISCWMTEWLERANEQLEEKPK